MTASSALMAGRRAAEAQMIDRCTVAAAGEFDPESGNPTPGATIYAGRCKVATYEPFERNPEVAGSTVTVQRYAVHVPVGSFDPEIGQVVTITSAALDPYANGRSFRVVALLHKSFATAYRLNVEEVP